MVRYATRIPVASARPGAGHLLIRPPSKVNCFLFLGRRSNVLTAYMGCWVVYDLDG